MIWTAFKAASLTAKIASVLLIVGGVATFYGVWHHRVYQRGVDDTIAAVARNDARVVAKATKARIALKDCQARNLTWDQTTGACR